jgi:hypothetical protein
MFDLWLRPVALARAGREACPSQANALEAGEKYHRVEKI